MLLRAGIARVGLSRHGTDAEDEVGMNCYSKGKMVDAQKPAIKLLLLLGNCI